MTTTVDATDDISGVSFVRLTYNRTQTNQFQTFVDGGTAIEFHSIESSPADQIQPKHSERFYRKPGDLLDAERPAIFDVASQRRLEIENALIPNAYSLSDIEWRMTQRTSTATCTTCPTARGTDDPCPGGSP